MRKEIKAFGYKITGIERLKKILIGHQEQLNEVKSQINQCKTKIQELQNDILHFRNNESVCEGLNEEKITDMPYLSLNVRGITYFYEKNDEVIPECMLKTGMNWAEADIENFIKISDHYYSMNKKGEGRSIPQKGLFLDIGGNIGTTSIYCKMKLKEELKFIAFEPLTVSARLFEANAAINGVLSDITVQKIALSDQKRKKAPMVINYQNWGGSGLVLGGEISEDEGEVVATTTLDSYLAENNIDQSSIKYIWIDVEGHEVEVLKGAASLYKKYKIPTCLEFNQNAYMLNQNYETMLKMLEEYFEQFVVCSKVADGKGEWRPIHEARLLWEEYDHSSCDLILI